ncbi:hypothetical protein HPB48_002090 [Haemaphysalis longicornis]|uniref:Uncharacterized protein n=1 Tax=Haemaphysalis longicornis TaxID=44386 RepID=A0A9J6FI61_HAELO|nr:hypothetical protein HPB48_002090 [Haemaphysalis longicornis]
MRQTVNPGVKKIVLSYLIVCRRGVSVLRKYCHAVARGRAEGKISRCRMSRLVEIQRGSFNHPKVAYRLPQTQGMATAMRFNPMSSDLVIIYNDNQVVEYSVEDKAYTKWCRDVYLAGGLTLRSMSPLTAITFDPALENIFFAYSDHELFVIDRQKSRQWLAFFEHIEGNEVMIIEVPPDQIIEGLPVPLWQKRFGT